MGLFDEIERNIREAMAEAQKAQRPSPPPPPVKQAAEKPQARPPVVEEQRLPTLNIPDYWDAQAEHSEAELRQHSVHNQQVEKRKNEAEQQHIAQKGKSVNKTRHMLEQILASRHGIAAAITANEIIGKPLALRKHRDHL